MLDLNVGKDFSCCGCVKVLLGIYGLVESAVVVNWDDNIHSSIGIVAFIHTFWPSQTETRCSRAVKRWMSPNAAIALYCGPGAKTCND